MGKKGSDKSPPRPPPQKPQPRYGGDTVGDPAPVKDSAPPEPAKRYVEPTSEEAPPPAPSEGSDNKSN